MTARIPHPSFSLPKVWAMKNPPSPREKAWPPAAAKKDTLQACLFGVNDWLKNGLHKCGDGGYGNRFSKEFSTFSTGFSTGFLWINLENLGDFPGVR